MLTHENLAEYVGTPGNVPRVGRYARSGNAIVQTVVVLVEPEVERPVCMRNSKGDTFVKIPA